MQVTEMKVTVKLRVLMWGLCGGPCTALERLIERGELAA